MFSAKKLDDEIPAPRVRDLFTRMDELLILLLEGQKRQNELLARLAGVRVPAPPVRVERIPLRERLVALREVFKELKEEELTRLIEEIKTTTEQIGGIPVFEFPLRPGLLPPLPVLMAMVQTLGYDHHKFTSLSYTTTAAKTLTKSLDDRLKEEGNIRPEQIIVGPTTETRVDFETEDEKPTITSTTPSILADQSLSSPLHPTAVLHQAVTTAGTLKIWMFWR